MLPQNAASLLQPRRELSGSFIANPAAISTQPSIMGGLADHTNNHGSTVSSGGGGDHHGRVFAPNSHSGASTPVYPSPLQQTHFPAHIIGVDAARAMTPPMTSSAEDLGSSRRGAGLREASFIAVTPSAPGSARSVSGVSVAAPSNSARSQERDHGGGGASGRGTVNGPIHPELNTAPPRAATRATRAELLRYQQLQIQQQRLAQAAASPTVPVADAVATATPTAIAGPIPGDDDDLELISTGTAHHNIINAIGGGDNNHHHQRQQRTGSPLGGSASGGGGGATGSLDAGATGGGSLATNGGGGAQSLDAGAAMPLRASLTKSLNQLQRRQEQQYDAAPPAALSISEALWRLGLLLEASGGGCAAAQPVAGGLLACDVSGETAETLLARITEAFASLPPAAKATHVVLSSQTRTRPNKVLHIDAGVWAGVCAYLSARDAERLGATCTRLHRFIRDSDFVWCQLCQTNLPLHFEAMLPCERPAAEPRCAPWRSVVKSRVLLDRKWYTRDPAEMDVRGMQVGRGAHTVILDGDIVYYTTSQHYEMHSVNLKTGERAYGNGINTGHTHSVTSMKIVSDFPEYIISASVDATMRVFDRHQKKSVGEFRGHTERVWGVDTYRELVFSGGTDRTVRMWNLQTNAQCGIVEEQHTSVSSVRVMRHGSAAYVACGSSGSSIRVWDIGDGVLRTVARFRGHQKGVYCLQDSGRLLFSGSLDNVIYGWDPRIQFGRALQLVQYDDNGQPVVNVATTGPSSENMGIVTFAVDDTKLVAGCADNAIRIWDLRMLRIVREFKEHSHWVTSVQMDQRKLVSTSRDRTIRIWDMDDTLDMYLHSSIGRPPPPLSSTGATGGGGAGGGAAALAAAGAGAVGDAAQAPMPVVQSIGAMPVAE